MNSILKKNLIHIIAIIIFMVICIFRLSPQLQNKVVNQYDATGAIGMQKEAQDYNATHDDNTYWTNSMFGGMPTYPILAPTFNGFSFFMKVLQGGFSEPIGFFFMSMICFYFLALVLGIEAWIGILTAITFSLCSNHMILWESGHTNKFFTISNASLVVAAVYAAYKHKKYWASAILMSFGLALNILSGHIQMTYYLFLSLLFLAFSYLIVAIREKKIAQFFKESSALTIGSILAIMICFCGLFIQYSYKEDTMRGKPILKNVAPELATSSSETSGLEWNYAMQWSNGPLDMLAMIIPYSAGGGNSEMVHSKSNVGKDLKRKGVNIKKLKLPYYFGSLPFTSGAIYFGVLVMCFFILACIKLRGPIQWWLISSTGLLLILSMGKNAEWFNLPFFKLIPLYSSFRAPNSILTVAYLPILIGALLGIKEVTQDSIKSKKAFMISTGAMALICLFVGFILPGMVDFSSPADAQFKNLGIDLNLVNLDRADMMRSDSLRSLLFLGLGALFYFFFDKNKISAFWFGIGIASIFLIDGVPIGYRYLNSNSWVTPKNNDHVFVPRAVDSQIKSLEPNRGTYRVLDVSINTFNSSITSYHHNTIGGYSAAKLQRFEDIRNRHINQNNMRVLNMLNTKYFITREQQLQLNSEALGNAWFIETIKKVDSPESEISALNEIDPAKTAVILDSEFNNYVGNFDPILNPSDRIQMTTYSPKEIQYQYNSGSDQFVVFSEVWYGPNKGWNATIDGVSTDHVRVNYILRGMKVPAGSHTIKFVFEPKGVAMGIMINKIGSGVFVLALIVYLFLFYKGKIE